MRRCRRRIDGEDIVRVALERQSREHFAPARSVAQIDRARLRIVALEECGIDVDAADDAANAEADDAPVVIAFISPAARLPAVHPLAALGVPPLHPDRRRGALAR